MFKLPKVFLKKNMIDKYGENFPNNGVWFAVHQKKEKPPAIYRWLYSFTFKFEGGDREWFSSIRDLLYSGNVLKLCPISKRNGKFLKKD